MEVHNHLTFFPHERHNFYYTHSFKELVATISKCTSGVSRDKTLAQLVAILQVTTASLLCCETFVLVLAAANGKI